MDRPMTADDSYADRRRLFKNIWDTAMNIDEKDADIMNKPKVIKTLRLDEIDRDSISKKKKQKLRNLRHVCNKILDFCDRQETDDLFYAQMNAEGERLTHNVYIKPKKLRNVRAKKKIKSKSLFSRPNSPEEGPSTSEKKDEFNADFSSKIITDISPSKLKKDGVRKSKIKAQKKDKEDKKKKI